MSQSVNRKIFLFVLLCLLLLITVLLFFYLGLPELNHLKHIIVTDLHNTYLKAKQTIDSEINYYNMDSTDFWKNLDLKTDEIPVNQLENISKISVNTNTMVVEGKEIFYLEANPQNANNYISILLLHGMAFTSQTWLELGTIKTMAALNYRTVAIDLPGFGQSSKTSEISNKSKFLQTLINKLSLKNPVIVSPSYSGYYSIPYLLENWNQMAGYIPVSPVGNKLTPNVQCLSSNNDEQNSIKIAKIPENLRKYLTEPYPNFDCIKTPTLIVLGEKDKNESGLRNSALLGLMPYSHIEVFPNGAHPAYLTDKNLWHKLLYNFLKTVSQFIKEKEK